MKYNPDQPLIVQSDFTVLVEVQHPRFEIIRTFLSKFADLIKSPEHVHTYKISPLSLWNAASAGLCADEIVLFLQMNIKFEIPKAVLDYIRQVLSRYGLIRLEGQAERIFLVCDEEQIFQQMVNYPSLLSYFGADPIGNKIQIKPEYRGFIKQELIKLGYPVIDLAGYHEGEALPIRLRETTLSGKSFTLREYQQQAIDAFYQEGSIYGGNGVLVLPCGAGKTIIGIGVMSRFHCATLILTTNVTSVRQWKQEILEKTYITEDMIGEYSGDRKEVRPITIATYQILTHRKNKDAEFSHMKLFNERDWGLIVYDEVHLLPAPVFRVTADIQATRRLGLTATLVREDGRAEDVFSLVGPKRFEKPWKDLEGDGWISKVQCTEVRIPLPIEHLQNYTGAAAKHQFRIAGENPLKLKVLRQLIHKHQQKPTLVIGQYLTQLKHISQQLDAPLITGEMPHHDRDQLYNQFKHGDISLLVVSKVANFAVDLPDAAVAIQVSGSFGSRQEEAQRLGRLLRPKQADNQAFFYSLVTSESKEQEFSMNRQLFLVEQGYRYRIENVETIIDGS